jgi:cysteine desulfurase
MLYLDYAASAPPYEEVIASVAEVMKMHYGNPSSIHRLGMQAERLVHKSKTVIADVLGVDPSREIICTSGGTESINLAIKGFALKNRKKGNHLITSQIEHAAALEAFAQLETQGFRVTYLPVDETGLVSLDKLKDALCADTILVSIMQVNNEVGRIQPINEIGQILRTYPHIKFHVDAVQGIGKLPVKPREKGIDLLSASAHKFGGPKGIGFLYCREGIQLEPLLAGGGQEHGLRSGTENVPLIVGMAKAIRLTTDMLHTHRERMRRVRRVLVDGIASIPELFISGSELEQDMAPHIVHFTFPGMKAEVVVHALERADIYISTKSACSGKDEGPSQGLLAMGYDRSRASSGLRVSFSGEQTEEDAVRFIAELRRVVAELTPARRQSTKGRGRVKS